MASIYETWDPQCEDLAEQFLPWLTIAIFSLWDVRFWEDCFSNVPPPPHGQPFPAHFCLAHTYTLHRMCAPPETTSASAHIMVPLHQPTARSGGSAHPGAQTTPPGGWPSRCATESHHLDSTYNKLFHQCTGSIHLDPEAKSNQCWVHATESNSAPLTSKIY